ncbi:MAG: zinc ribbon domain-containing protein [Syntrophobacteraceae bacterium]|jgi:putative FmdB family regulatory protein|nr:zinc ribbon domain-containing protein [Syntrophobacteraceae bacterium]
MPIYEFRCRDCGKKSEVITFRVSEEVAPTCGHCGSEAMSRLMSRVRVRLSEETRMERLADPSRLGGIDENDPRSMAKWMKTMTQEMGEDFEGEDVDAMIEEAMEEESGGGAAPGGSPAGDDL